MPDNERSSDYEPTTDEIYAAARALALYYDGEIDEDGENVEQWYPGAYRAVKAARNA